MQEMHTLNIMMTAGLSFILSIWENVITIRKRFTEVS
jgi:hypothetical protein